jgi:hypothetical protein
MTAAMAALLGGALRRSPDEHRKSGNARLRRPQLELLTLTTTPVIDIYFNLGMPCSAIPMMVRPASP